jgi:hypothetical protein
MERRPDLGHLGGPMAARAATMLAYYRAVKRKHKGLSGGRREDLVKDFLTDFLPARFAADRGEVVSTDGPPSDAVDLIVYDAAETPLLDRSDAGGVVVPVEGVYAAIEVSSYLDCDKLRKDLENIRSVKQMTKRAFFTEGVPRPVPISLYGEKWTIPERDFPPLGFCFAYDSVDLKTLRDCLQELDEGAPAWNKIDVICCLSKGLILNGEPMKDADGRIRTNERGTELSKGPPAATPVAPTERLVWMGPEDDEGAWTLKTFYTHAFGTIVRLRTAPINMWEYQRRE